MRPAGATPLGLASLDVSYPAGLNEAADVRRGAARDFGIELHTADDEQRARVAAETAARLAGLPRTAGIEVEARPFYRVLYGHPASPARRAFLEYVYGAALIFDPRTDPRSHESAPLPIRMRGTVLHDDPIGDAEAFLGDANPAVEQRELHDRLGDKWEEFELLRRAAPKMAPPTFRGDAIAAEIDPAGELRGSDPRGFLVAIQAELGGRFGKYILKTRRGFGSDGHLPTHEDDFGPLWDSFQKHLVPAREKLRATITDPEELTAHLFEHVRYSEGQILEALVEDPSSIVIQPFIPNRDEIRVHVVEGRVLEGATVGRWAKFGHRTEPEDVRRLEAAVTEMLAKIREPISFTADVLVTDDGFQIIDLNSGLESGMYQPDGDVAVTNLLAARFLGHETPYLRDLRRFEEAPLEEKLEHALAMERIIGAWVRKNESYGFYDRLVSGYIAAVARDPRPAVLREAFRQATRLAGVDAWELYRLLMEPASAPAVAGLEPGELRRMLHDLNARDSGSVSGLAKDPKPGELPFVRAPEVEYGDAQIVGWLAAEVRRSVGPRRRPSGADVRRAIERWVITRRQFVRDPQPSELHPGAIRELDRASMRRLLSTSSTRALARAVEQRLIDAR